NSAYFDELYSYDGLNRLSNMQRGRLNGSKTGITNSTFAQCWTLDPTGNWRGFREDSNGDASWDLIQARTANPVNEITGFSNSVGTAWASPSYDSAGNMIQFPKATAPGTAQTAVYDAWNRMIRISEGDQAIAEYDYDPRTFRIVSRTYSSGVLSETRHHY